MSTHSLTASPFHGGELAVQARAGVQESARRVGGSIHATIPAAAQEFLRSQPLAVVATQGADGAVWASLLAGRPGFLSPLDEGTLRIDAAPTPGDPLAANLRAGGQIGLLAIELATRRRMRLNGWAELSPHGGLLVHAEQVYSNCPKYIQIRAWDAETDGAGLTEAPAVHRDDRLTDVQRAWMERADTFFIATTHPTGGADASHRGGMPGFVRAQDDRTLVFPDYAGNTMFNTLGNIQATGRAGLLFVDFERGDTLQVSGVAQIVWDVERATAFPGAERLVELEVRSVVQLDGAVPLRGRLVEYSPHNPR